MSMTSTSLAISRVCVLVISSFAFTTAMSTLMSGLSASNCALKSSMNATNGGFWWMSTRSVSCAVAGTASAATATAVVAAKAMSLRIVSVGILLA